MLKIVFCIKNLIIFREFLQGLKLRSFLRVEVSLKKSGALQRRSSYKVV